MYQQGRNTIHRTQDWQIDAYEMRGRHNSIVRHQRVIEEMDTHPTTWGVNMSKGRNK